MWQVPRLSFFPSNPLEAAQMTKMSLKCLKMKQEVARG